MTSSSFFRKPPSDVWIRWAYLIIYVVSIDSLRLIIDCPIQETKVFWCDGDWTTSISTCAKRTNEMVISYTCMCVRPQSSSLVMAVLREGKKKPSVDIWDTGIPTISRLSSCGPLIGWAFVFIDTPGYWPHWSCQMALPTRWSSNSMCSNVQIRSFDKHQPSLLVYLCGTSSPNTIITGFFFFSIFFYLINTLCLPSPFKFLICFFANFQTLLYFNKKRLCHQCVTFSDSFTSALTYIVRSCLKLRH